MCILYYNLLIRHWKLFQIFLFLMLSLPNFWQLWTISIFDFGPWTDTVFGLVFREKVWFYLHKFSFSFLKICVYVWCVCTWILGYICGICACGCVCSFWHECREQMLLFSVFSIYSPYLFLTGSLTEPGTQWVIHLDWLAKGP